MYIYIYIYLFCFIEAMTIKIIGFYEIITDNYYIFIILYTIVITFTIIYYYDARSFGLRISINNDIV